MPVLDVGISVPGARIRATTVEMIVDTGGDATVLPRELLEGIRAPFSDRSYMRGVTGAGLPVDLFWVTLHIGSLRVPNVRVVANDVSDSSILGRNALNYLNVALLGPAQVLEVLK
jgi:predicted aspartyl protease